MRWRCSFILVAAVGATLSCSSTSDDVFPGKNLIVIGLDTVRADHLGVYGMTPSPTPEIDAIAAESVVFERAYSTASWTLPSFASLFTGLLPSEHGSVGGAQSKLPEGRLTLAELLNAHGYATHGYVAVDWLTDSFAMDQGFDRLSAYVKGKVSVRYEQYEKEVHAFLDSPPSEPYFLFVHIYDAHAPYRPPPPFDGMYYSGDPKSPDKSSLAVIFSEESQQRAMHPLENLYGWLEGVTDIDYPIAQYKAGVSYLDRKLGDLMARLRESGQLERSVVAIVGDHGEHLTEHGFYFTHALPYEETLRIPFLVRLPDARHAGTAIQQEVSGVDFFPTIAELLELPNPANLTGHSLVPLLSDPEADLDRRWLFAEWGGSNRYVRAVWNRDFRLVRHQQLDGSEYELFDRQNDPAETTSIADARPEIVERLAAVLERRYEGLNVPGGIDEAPELDKEVEERLRALGYL